MVPKVVLVALFCVGAQVGAQLFGGRQGFPGGGSHQQVGYQAGPAWGSLSQSSNGRGKTGPITYGAGADFNRNGHGLSGSVQHIPGVGGQGSIRGQTSLFDNGRHQVGAWVQHDRNLDKNFKPIGRETNSGGLNYQHANGANAFLSGSKTPGSPSRGSVGGSIPLYQGKNVQVKATGQTDFGHGMKPQHQVGLGVSGQF